MLQTIHKYSGSWFIKIVFGLIVLSFLGWGVSDVVRNLTTKNVVKVGAETISNQTLLYHFKKAVTHLQKKMSNEEIKSLDLEKQVLDELIRQSLLRQEVKRLGLVATDRAVKERIQIQPAFQVDKKFNHYKLKEFLENRRMSEHDLIEEVQKDIVNEQLISSIGRGFTIPKPYLDFLVQGVYQKRKIELVEFSFDSWKSNAMPSDSELETFYKQNKQVFSEPEYRGFSYIQLSYNSLQNKISIKEQDLFKAYEERKKEFVIDEKRVFRVFSFTNKKTAMQALEILKKDTNLESIKKKFKVQDVVIGPLDKLQIPDGTSFLFKQKFATWSEPIQVEYSLATGHNPGWTIFFVEKIEPRYTPSLGEVSDVLTQALKKEKFSEYIYEIQTKIEDELANGSDLSVVAKNFAIPIINVVFVNQNGHDMDGKKVFNDPKVLQTIFNTQENSDTGLIENKEGESIIGFVNKITPAKLPALTEIKDKAIKIWQTHQGLLAANEFAQSFDKKQDIQKIIQEKNGRKIEVAAFSQINPPKNIPGDLIYKVFLTKKNHLVFTNKDNKIFFAFVKDIIPFNGKPDDKFVENLQMRLQQDFLDVFLQNLRHRYAVSTQTDVNIELDE